MATGNRNRNIVNVRVPTFSNATPDSATSGSTPMIRSYFVAMSEYSFVNIPDADNTRRTPQRDAQQHPRNRIPTQTLDHMDVASMVSAFVPYPLTIE